MADKYVTDNDDVVKNLNRNLLLVSSYLTSAATVVKSAYGPDEYSSIFKERITTARDNTRTMRTTVETNKTIMSNNSKYNDCTGAEGTWIYRG
jgi:hypothetical protein